MSLAEIQNQIVARYRIIEDPQERLAAIVGSGKKWPAPNEAECDDAHLVRGCVSQVWLAPQLKDGVCLFLMKADSPMVQGLTALICELYEGASPQDVAAFEPELLSLLGLDRQLSPTRLNGLENIRRTIREFATAEIGK